MLEQIISLDEKLFLMINRGWACGFLDAIMPILTDDSGAFILIGILLLFAVLGKRKGIIVAIITLLAVGLTDLINDDIFKDFIGRERPCHHLPARLLAKCSGTDSFPSSHAANIFAFALSLGINYKKSLFGLLPLAIMVALSRVYVGVHYPFDITAGAIFGILMGILFGLSAKWINLKIDNRREKNKAN